MNIINFDDFRVGKFPVSLDIQTDGNHSYYEFSAGFAFYDNLDLAKVELRHKGNEYRLFLYRFSDLELYGDWIDAEIVWSISKE